MDALVKIVGIGGIVMALVFTGLRLWVWLTTDSMFFVGRFIYSG